MEQLKNKKIILFFSILLLSCMDNQDYIIKKQVPVNIYESTVPTNGTINQDIQIQLKAQAGNSCYSDLKIKLIEIDSRHFLFKATGLFQSNGACLDVVVGKDTIINFRPTLTGNYFFQTNEDPFKVRNDTIDID